MPFVSAGELKLPREQVAVALTHGRFGGHVGLIFQAVQRVPEKRDVQQLLHLRWHKKLDVEEFPLTTCWVAAIVDLPAAQSKQVVGVVRSAAKRRPDIPYGLNVLAAKGSFDESGSYKPPKDSDGLTCATFVAEFFQVIKLPLVRLDTWKESEENKKWGQEVCDLLAQTVVDTGHVEAVRRNISGLRLRPEEVAAAGASPAKQRPMEFDSLQPLAVEANAQRDHECPLPEPPPQSDKQNQAESTESSVSADSEGRATQGSRDVPVVVVQSVA